MSLLNTGRNKNILALGVLSAVAAVFFSFLGAPLLRTFSVTAGSKVFWITGFSLFSAMLGLGLVYYQVSETAVYVGAIWMTLGSYSELEKRGVNWKASGLFSLIAGFCFALAGYFLIVKTLSPVDTLAEFLEPVRAAISKSMPQSDFDTTSLVLMVPGMFTASLLISLGLGFAFEAKVAKIFRINRERVASSLRGLDFRLPNSVVWLTLFSALVVTKLAQPLPEWQLRSPQHNVLSPCGFLKA